MEKSLNCKCPLLGHDNLPYITICCKVDCELPRLNCLKCLLRDHTSCNESMIRIEDVKQDNLELLQNWYDDPFISEIAEYLKQKEMGLAEKFVETRNNATKQ